MFSLVLVFLFFFFFITAMSFLFFFFQAEDGIRDGTVTGVQTCALPISPGTTPSSIFPHDWRPPQTAPAVPEHPSSSTPCLLPRSLRARRSVKYVPRHFVKDVMRLNTYRHQRGAFTARLGAPPSSSIRETASWSSCR